VSVKDLIRTETKLDSRVSKMLNLHWRQTIGTIFNHGFMISSFIDRRVEEHLGK